MFITIDFNSEEAYYIQIRNQIILAIANEQLREGENLPSVRSLAETIGINMHTVNKAYGILREEGFLKLDRRKGAIIAVDIDRYKATLELMEAMRVLIARGICKDITRNDVHALVDQIYNEFSS